MRSWRPIATAALVAMGVAVVAGCQNGSGSPVGIPDTSAPVSTPGAPTVTTGAPAMLGCPVPALGPVDSKSVLVPRPSNGLPPSNARGDGLMIVAVVLDTACNPAEGASLNIWHTDARGDYGPPGGQECCYYQGTTQADQNGRFRLDTIRPGQYRQASAPPAHIHLEIRHSSGRLDSEIVFAENPLPTGPVRPSGTVPVVLRSVGGAQGNSWYGEAVFVLER